MTLELVDGKAGRPHIGSADKAIIHQATRGSGSCILDWGDGLSCSMQDSTHAVIGTGAASLQGLDWTVTAPETLNIMPGTQSQRRNDIIAAVYTKQTNGIESVALRVYRGTPTSGTPTDPDLPSGEVLNGATEAAMPLWRIPLDGITVGVPVRVAPILQPISAITSPITCQWKPPYTNQKVQMIRIGGLVCVSGFVSQWNGPTSWQLSVSCSERIPAGYAPSSKAGIAVSAAGTKSADQASIEVFSDSTMNWHGACPSGGMSVLNGVWATNDPMPPMPAE